MAVFSLTGTALKTGAWILRTAYQIDSAPFHYLYSKLDDDAQAVDDIVWQRFHVRWSRATPTGTSEDKGEFKLDVLNITAGDPDSSWTSTDLTNVHNALYTLRTSLLPTMAPNQSFIENVAYAMQYNPAYDPKHPFQPSGPPSFSASSTQAGTGSGVQAYQVAGSVTFKTPFPHHWGRAYMPTPATSQLDSNGRFTSSYRSTVGGAWRTCFDTLQGAGFYPVIPMTQLGKTPTHQLMNVPVIQVDDIPDVIRSRRPKQTGARTIV